MEPASNASAVPQGIVSLRSPYPFRETVQRLLAAFADKGIKVFATIDQRAEALAVGLSLPPTTLILFGNPKAGTPLMLANPQAGVDLPLKVLVYERSPGDVIVSFATAAEIGRRHGLAPELIATIAPSERLVAGVLGQ
jgi:uncharacterized protein (DUF302 family)